MSLELWFSFVLASAALLAIPGPTVMLVVSYALGRGRASGWATVPGVALGDFTAMTISLAGAGAILATSATLFTMMKFAGALYLIWLGISLWRAKPVISNVEAQDTKASGASMFWNAYMVTALNPKGIIFFVSFVPQFINPHQPALLQFAVLEVTFLTMAAANVALWAILAGQLRSRFQHPNTIRKINKIGASCLISAGLVTAMLQRTNS